MNVIKTQPNFYLAPITLHQQDVAGNAQALTIGDGLLSSGKALMASTPGFISIPNPASSNPLKPNMALCLELGDKNRFCLGILDQTSMKVPVQPGDTCMYNSTYSYIKIDSTDSMGLYATKGSIYLQTLKHGTPLTTDQLVDTINGLITALNTQIAWNDTLIQSMLSLANSGGNCVPTSPPPTVNPTVPKILP